MTTPAWLYHELQWNVKGHLVLLSGTTTSAAIPRGQRIGLKRAADLIAFSRNHESFRGAGTNLRIRRHVSVLPCPNLVSMHVSKLI